MTCRSVAIQTAPVSALGCKSSVSTVWPGTNVYRMRDGKSYNRPRHGPKKVSPLQTQQNGSLSVSPLTESIFREYLSDLYDSPSTWRFRDNFDQCHARAHTHPLMSNIRRRNQSLHLRGKEYRSHHTGYIQRMIRESSSVERAPASLV